MTHDYRRLYIILKENQPRNSCSRCVVDQWPNKAVWFVWTKSLTNKSGAVLPSSFRSRPADTDLPLSRPTPQTRMLPIGWVWSRVWPSESIKFMVSFSRTITISLPYQDTYRLLKWSAWLNNIHQPQSFMGCFWVKIGMHVLVHVLTLRFQFLHLSSLSNFFISLKIS